MIDSKGVILIFDAHSHPDVLMPGQSEAQFFEAFGSFGQDLELMPTRLTHHRKHAQDKFQGHAFVKKVTHGVDENPLRLFPA